MFFYNLFPCSWSSNADRPHHSMNGEERPADKAGIPIVILGTDHYFLGGGGMKNFLCNFFFSLCTSANIFFEILIIFCYTYRVCKQFILSF